MKRTALSLMLACVLELSLVFEAASQPASPNTNAPAAPVAPTVIARSLSSRTWARIISQTNASGVVSSVTNKAYTELASGLCYESGGQLVDSVEQIDIVADGASATQAQHKVHFAGNANTAGGAVILNTRDGKTFASRVYGLSYWDTACGTNILLAPLQDYQGTLVGTNRVVYTNAFSGLNADLEYVFTKSGLEQNVILREQLPPPDSLGLAAASTRLEVLSEFFSPPAPNKKKTHVINGISEDTLIDFGGMGIGMGKAFSIPGQDGQKTMKLGRVSKHWTRLGGGDLGGRDFLIEEVPYQTISNAVQNLPAHASAAPVGTAVKHLAALEPLLPRAVTSTATPTAMQLADSMPERPGVVLDYMEFDYADIGGYVFQDDTTYYINGYLALAAAPVFEGGTVLKFESRYSGTAIQNYGDSLCTFNGSPYRPVVCTLTGDNSVGDTIWDSDYGFPLIPQTEFIYEDGGGGGAPYVSIDYVRFSYAGTGYEDDNDLSHIFRDCQFVQCTGAVVLPNDTNVYLLNDLFTACGAVVQGNDMSLDAENITADSINCFASGYWPNYNNGGITNSILTGCDDSIYYFDLDNCVIADSGSAIYQSAGDGNYYLAQGTYQGAGTANINPSLLAELQTKTTCPPTFFGPDLGIFEDMNCGIAAPRDSGTPGPDIGYHYDPLDYVFGGVQIIECSATFSNGVAVGWYNGRGFGISLCGGNSVNFLGTATAPDWWVRCNTVQESGGNTVWPGAGAEGGLVQGGEANLLFTHCSILAGGDGGPLNHFEEGGLNATNSEFYGGYLDGYNLSCEFMNCLMDRLDAGQSYTGNPWIMTNCTWHGGSLTLGLTNTIPTLIVVRDSAFDGTGINVFNNAGNGWCANYDYNAFGDGAAPFPIGGRSNVFVNNGFNWQSSLLGNYYLPSSSQLIAVGDVTADQIGLSDFTTQVNQVPEGNAIVDIGYHYPLLFLTNYNCISTPGGQLGIGLQEYFLGQFCVGEWATNIATWTDIPGLVSCSVSVSNGYGNPVITTNAVYSTILTNWNVVYWNGGQMISYGSGVTSGYSFTPTNTGLGTNVFYYTYANPPPCGGTYTISISNTFSVVGVGSLAPANTANWIEISNTPPGTRTFLVQANPTNGQNSLEVNATPTPNVRLFRELSCWSLNGKWAQSINLDISAPAVYEVDCVCGTSGLTNIIIVTTNTVMTNIGYTTIGLVAYWSMDEGSGTTAHDTSGNGVDVPLFGSPSWGSNYLTLNGNNQYGDAGTNALTNLDDSDMTICGWINTLSTDLQGIVTKEFYQSSTNYGGWWFAIESNQLSWNLLNGSVIYDTGPGIVPLGQWVFLAVTWSYTNNSDYEACFYVNGQSNSAYFSYNHPTMTEKQSGPSDLFVGNLQIAPGAPMFLFDGFMRDLAVYNRALSAGEILTNFFNTEPSTNVPCPDLLYYTMTNYGVVNGQVVLSNSAMRGVADGFVLNTNDGVPTLPDWVDNPGNNQSAIHFHGLTPGQSQGLPGTLIDTYNSTLFNFTTQPFTINVWLGPYVEACYFMGNDTSSNSGWYLSENGADNAMIRLGGETNTLDYATAQDGGQVQYSGPLYSPAEWHMVTITRDGINTPLIYIDAEVVPTTPGFTSPAPSANPLIFGFGTANNGPSCYDGDMWLPQIWSVNLSPSEVANLFFNQKKVLPGFSGVF